MAKKLAATGLILGKFLPPHQGHQYLFDFAQNYVDRLIILVGTLESEPIPGHLRHAWVEEMAPRAQVLHLTDENPQYPHEHPDFWRIWQDSIRRLVPNGPDYVFASEDYGFKLAEILGAAYIPVDHARELVPISGSELRSDPLKNWRYLPPCVRPYFVRRVCIVGPESTGKSVLARRLAEHYGTVHVNEYARGLLSLRGDQVDREVFPLIARGHAASEDALARQAQMVLFCDTDLIVTTIWSEAFFGDCPQWIRDWADERTYDLYLVADIDVPWVDDPQRFLPNQRPAFLARCRSELEKRGRPYVMVGGDWEERFRQAIQAVDQLLARPRP
jgi:NadR type nicotinamide-nucleotide adenylyltransferase